jgi:hypothetical protein
MLRLTVAALKDLISELPDDDPVLLFAHDSDIAQSPPPKGFGDNVLAICHKTEVVDDKFVTIVQYATCPSKHKGAR